MALKKGERVNGQTQEKIALFEYFKECCILNLENLENGYI